MDPSALIFVALAIAWAVYLIPKALEHHDTSERARTVDRFSSALRVLARRDAVSRKETRLLRSHETGASLPRVAAPAPEPAPAPSARQADDSGFLPAQTFVRRSAAARAARRRRRVALVLVLAHALVASLAVAQVISWIYLLAPVGLLALWLYACRRMVVRERSARRVPGRVPGRVPVRVAPPPVAETAVVDETTDIPVVEEPLVAPPAGWEPVSTLLPTYVSKPMAPPRSVRTIDLDSTGVWSSGRSAADSALAQQADAARKTPTEAEERRIAGA